MSSTEYSKHLDELEKVHYKTVEMLNNSRPINVNTFRKNMELKSAGFSWREGIIVAAAITAGLVLGLYIL